MATTGFFDLPPELRSEICAQVLEEDKTPAAFRKRSQMLVQPTGLGPVSRWMAVESSALLTRYAPLVVFEVVDLDFTDVIAWINGLQSPVAATLYEDKSERNRISDLDVVRPTPKGFRELRIELSFTHREDRLAGEEPSPTIMTAAAEWIDCFDNEEGRLAEMNIRYEIVNMNVSRDGTYMLTHYTGPIARQLRQVEWCAKGSQVVGMEREVGNYLDPERRAGRDKPLAKMGAREREKRRKMMERGGHWWLKTEEDSDEELETRGSF